MLAQKLDGFALKSAFLLNANAKNVNDKVVGRLLHQIPSGDLYYARSIKQSEMHLRSILKRGYGFVYSGGGDGTFMNVLNTLRKLTYEAKSQMPALGILKLGTGNALASVLNANNPATNVKQAVSQIQTYEKRLPMVECEDGNLAPFAGVGCDGELLNDYCQLKNKFKNTVFSPIIQSVFGYILAGFGKTLPRRLLTAPPTFRVVTNTVCKRISIVRGKRVEETFLPGEIIFEGSALVVSAGSIPYFGYGLKMFPFAEESSQHIQLRICACHPLYLISRIYPQAWKGRITHPLLFDFLVKDVSIESTSQLPYQIGGDACGHREAVRFKASQNPIKTTSFRKDSLIKTSKLKNLLPISIPL